MNLEEKILQELFLLQSNQSTIRTDAVRRAFILGTTLASIKFGQPWDKLEDALDKLLQELYHRTSQDGKL